MTVLLVFIGLILFGMPIGFSIGIAGVVGLIMIGGGNFLAIAPSKVFSGLDAFPFLAMPFFTRAARHPALRRTELRDGEPRDFAGHRGV